MDKYHQGLELAQYLVRSPNKLEALCAYSHRMIIDLGITIDDPRYNELTKLSQGVIEGSDTQKFFRYLYRLATYDPDHTVPSDTQGEAKSDEMGDVYSEEDDGIRY